MTSIKASQEASWARAAGVENVKKNNSEKQSEYARLRAEGATQKAAITAVGVGRRTSYRWDQAILAACDQANGIEDSDDPGIAYKGSVIAKTTDTERAVLPTLAGADPMLTTVAAEAAERPGKDTVPPVPEDAAPGPVRAIAPRPVTLEDLEQDIASRYLAQHEREVIADMLRAKKSMRAIGRALDRDPGTISREIKRNSHPRLGYQPYGAHRKAVTARARPKPSKLATDGPLREYVKEKLLTRWSPEQISKTLIKEFPDDEQMRVSHETIYHPSSSKPAAASNARSRQHWGPGGPAVKNTRIPRNVALASGTR